MYAPSRRSNVRHRKSKVGLQTNATVSRNSSGVMSSGSSSVSSFIPYACTSRLTRRRRAGIVARMTKEERLQEFTAWCAKHITGDEKGEAQMDEPVDTVALTDLPARWGPLAFLAPGAPDPSFGNDRIAVTRNAANALAELCGRIIGRGVERPLAQRIILQCLVALFTAPGLPPGHPDPASLVTADCIRPAE
jgi:hypothetical protein